MSVKSIPHHTPLLYSKTVVYRGIPIFLLWVQDRTASPRQFYLVPTINVLSIYIKKIQLFTMKFSVFKLKEISVIAYSKFS